MHDVTDEPAKGSIQVKARLIVRGKDRKVIRVIDVDPDGTEHVTEEEPWPQF